MSIYEIISALGGLALFLYGMDLLSKSLENMNGGRLEKILGNLTNNLFNGILLGAFVTSIIQSSSATTVMVVGLVNSNILSLNQSVGVIMGANIGTTITSWILSLVGISSSSFFLNLLKPSSFAPLLALVGVILIVMKKDKTKDIGEAIFGLAILLIGMNTMSSNLSGLSSLPIFQQVMETVSNPLLGVLVGLIVTAILQSSSASIGILQALALGGTIRFSAVLPIIMGQNMGTCVTALLSSVGAGKNAKKAALVHFYFNMIGSIVFMIAFYSLHAFFRFSFVNSYASVSEIALIHTSFNLITTIFFLPISNVLVVLANKTIKMEDVQEVAPFIDERFLDTPTFALNLAYEKVIEMGKLAEDELFCACSLLHAKSDDILKKVKHMENVLDEYEDKLNEYLTNISKHGLNTLDSRKLNMMILSIHNMERISDRSRSISKILMKYQPETSEIQEDLRIYMDAIYKNVRLMLHYLEWQEDDDMMEIESLTSVIRDITDKMNEKYVNNETYSVTTNVVVNKLISNLKRISDMAYAIDVYEYQLNHNEGIHEIKQRENSFDSIQKYEKMYTIKV